MTKAHMMKMARLGGLFLEETRRLRDKENAP